MFRDLAAQAKLDLNTVTLTDVARSEDDAVESVRRGEADVTFGLEAVALSYGLRFTPLIQEEFALLVDRKAWFQPGFQTFIQFCRTDAFVQRAAAMGGYDLAGFGRVLWNA